MRFDRQKDISPKYLFLALTIICVILLFMSFFVSDRIAMIKGITGRIVTPLQKGINEIGIWTDSKIENMQKIEALTEENEKLREQLDESRRNETMYQNRLSELESLQKLYSLDELYPKYNTTGAHVFAKDSSSWFCAFYIDKGTDDGIYEGANVLSGEGLAGIVTECHNDYSKVRAIIDDNSKVSAKIMPSNALCTAEGSVNIYQDGYITVTDIDKDAKISIGDKVVTSNISDRYHGGLAIGYVAQVSNDPNNLTKTALITPCVDYNNIDAVLIITDETNSIDTN